MKTIIVNVNLDRASSMSLEAGDLTWDDAKDMMKSQVAQTRFLGKVPVTPKAVRLGDVRVIIVGFREPRHG